MLGPSHGPSTLGLLEDGAPDPPAGKIFSVKMRNEYIRAGRCMPPATRVPTERSLHAFLKTVLCDEEYFSALTDYRNSKPTVMDLIAKTMTKQLLPIAGAKCDIGKVVRSTLKSNKLSNSYSLEATKRKLQPKSFDECCALDYYLRDSYAKRFHAYIIYRFFLFVQTKNEKLRSVTTSADNCIVCLERAARTAQEGGEPVLWRQAEPCLHWTCDSCTRKLILAGRGAHCQQCFTKVISYAKGSAPAGNQ